MDANGSSGCRAWRWFVGLPLLLAALLGLFVLPAAALPPGCSQSGQTVTCTYTSGSNPFAVPAGVSAVRVVAVGGMGGLGGGHGAAVTGDVRVVAGSTLYAVVGANGRVFFPGGDGGKGGNPGYAFICAISPNTFPLCVSGVGVGGGGGGGGASDVRTSQNDRSSRLVVAAGAGGNGGGPLRLPSNAIGPGGGGGNGGGHDGSPASSDPLSGGGGRGAGSSGGGSGGVGGTGDPTACFACSPGGPGGPGAIGSGGDGGNAGLGGQTRAGVTFGGGGGGGGGGLFGGGAGGGGSIVGGGGGGGGSNLVPPGGSQSTDTTATPLVKISYTLVATSKDQCKNGGWRQFGFKNQGQCVAFVNHQARQTCLAERATIGRPAFRAKYGKGPQHRNALQRCIRRTAQG